MRTPFIWAVAACFVVTVGAITILVVTGHDPGALVAFLTGLPATVASVYVLIRTNVVEAKVNTISRNVNGHLDRLSDAAGLPPKPTDPQQQPTAGSAP